MFPSEHGDQLAPAVLVTRSIQTMQRKKYTTRYQVHRVHAGYKGIDTCNIHDVGRFDIQSDILYNNEQLTLRGRKDIQEHFDSLVKRGIINTATAKLWREDETMFETSESMKEWMTPSIFGATTLTFMDAIELQRVMSHPHVAKNMVVQRYGTTSGELRNEPFSPTWPKTHFHVHPYNCYGAPPKIIAPLTCPLDASNVWLLTSMVAWFPSLWVMIDKRVQSKDEWFGWFLTFVSKHGIVPGLTNSIVYHTKEDPYPYHYNANDSDEADRLETLIGLMNSAFRHVRNAGEIDQFAHLCAGISETDIVTVQLRPNRNYHLGHYIRAWTSAAIAGSTLSPSIPQNCQFIIFHRTDEVEDYVDRFDILNGGKYKLCYLAMVDKSLGYEFDDWNVLGCCRHREDAFNQWWCFQRHCQPYQAHKYPLEGEIGDTTYEMNPVHELPFELLERWQIAIYVNYDKDMDEIHSKYFEAIGGQKEVNCNGICHNEALFISKTQFILTMFSSTIAQRR